jgi:hypothetical protein
MYMDQVLSFDQATLEAMVNNLKGITDAWQSEFQNQNKQRQGLQDKLNDQHLRFVEDQHTLVMRTADANALVSGRVANNHASWDNLVLAGALTNPAELAESAIGAKVAAEVRSAAKEAMEASTAAIGQTSAAAQGTTGVAQGALQTQVAPEIAQIILNNNTIQTALLAELAKIEQALSVILVKVAGEAIEGKA